MAFGSTDPFGSSKSSTVNKYMTDSQSHFQKMPAPQSNSALSSTGGLAQPTPALGQAQAPDTNGSSAIKTVANTEEGIQGTSIRPANADELGLVDHTADIGRAANDMANTDYSQKMKARQSSLDGLGYMGSSMGGGMLDGLDAEQSANVSAIVNAAKARGLGDQEAQIGIMTALAESGLKNLNYGDRDSLGLFQQRPSQGWGAPSQVTDPNYAAGKFFDNLKGTSGDPWVRAQAVQRSAFGDGSNYKAQWDRATAIYAQYQAGARSAPTVGKNGAATWITANTGKYLDFDGAYGAQCVDLYDFYTTGFVGGKAPMVGYADEIWQNHDRSVYSQVANNQKTQYGDVAVWGKGGNTPMSHVGIILEDLGNGFVKTLSNNATSAGSRGTSAVVVISKSNLLGYLRPNSLR